MSNKTWLQIRIDQELKDRLQMAAESDNRSMSSYVLNLIDKNTQLPKVGAEAQKAEG